MSQPERYRRNTIHTNATNDFALISCSWCGSYVDDPDAHTNACPKIKPEPPDPSDVMEALFELWLKAADRDR